MAATRLCWLSERLLAFESNSDSSIFFNAELRHPKLHNQTDSPTHLRGSRARKRNLTR